MKLSQMLTPLFLTPAPTLLADPHRFRTRPMRERFWRVLVGQLRDAVDGADHQTSGVEHVLRFEMA